MKLNEKISGIVFDMDGLMFNTEWVVKHSWDLAGKELGYENFGDNIYNTLGMNFNARKEYFLNKYGNDFDFEKFTDMYRAHSLGYLEENGTPVKKGLFELLEYLKKEEVPMAVATSSTEQFAMSKLTETKVKDYFDYIICGSMVEFSKPHPQIYQIACRELGIDPSKAIALEDAPNGIRAALGAGMNVVMIPDLLKDAPKEIEEKLMAKLESLDKVIELLEEINTL